MFSLLQRTVRQASPHSQLFSRCFASRTLPLFKELPPHEILPMPALSPTMEFGGVARWIKQQGESISAGDIIAEIETDKATIDFEAQDDGFLAKILVTEGTSDVPCGTPMAITVEEESDVAAFADFVAPTLAAAATPEPEPEPKVVAAAAAPAPIPTPTPTPTPTPATPNPTAHNSYDNGPAGTVDPTLSFDRYGSGVRSSALSSHLLATQLKYNELYGSTLLESKESNE